MVCALGRLGGVYLPPVAHRAHLHLFPGRCYQDQVLAFLVFTFLGSFIWCGLLALGGYYLGANWEELRRIMRPFDIPIAMVIVAFVAYYIYHHMQRGKRRAANSK